jgi:hypothetical protein
MTDFQIVTYVSKAFVSALLFTLPSWVANAGAAKIVVYTDHPAVFDGAETRYFFEQPSDDPRVSWRRKIDSLADAYARCSTQFFCWLDADVYSVAEFSEVFERMGTAEIAATRMFNNTSRGQGAINAGVLFFQRSSRLPQFFQEWAAATDKLSAARWAEQTAASNLIHSAFHGERSYYATPVSENLYNLEDDSNPKWLARIKRYRPKLIHFKDKRWRDSVLVQSALNHPE